MSKYYTALIIMSALTLLVLIVLAVKNNTFFQKQKKAIVITSLMIILASACEYVGVLLNGSGPKLRTLHIIVKCTELSIVPVIPVILGLRIFPMKSAKWFLIPIGLHTLVEILSIWLGITFFVDANNVYTHCDLYVIYYIAYALGMVFWVIQVFRFSKLYQNHNIVCLVFIVLFLLCGITANIVDSSLKIVWLTVAIGYVLFFIYFCDIIQQSDSVTKLLNRRTFDNTLRSIRKRVLVIYMDIDGFKACNDTYGHQFGDVCLEMVGLAMRKAYDKYGLCYRIGGDEFCVVLYKQLEDVDAFNANFEQLLDKMRLAELHLPTVSIGYAPFDPSTMSAEHATAAADEMLYLAKTARKQNAPLP